jgi:glycosyltransferase involved in cell wall biosynthesis
MRVAIVARTAKRRGGTETYLFDLVRGFRRAAHSIDVFTANDSKDSPARAAGAAVHVSPLRLVPASIRPWVFRAALSAPLRRERHDLVISLARVNGGDIAICGGTHRGYLRALGRRWNWRDRSEIALEERCYRESGMIVAHSRRLRDELLELYSLPSEKVRVIHPPIDTSVYHATPGVARAEYKRQFGLDPQRTTLLFPSTGHARKGLPLLLDALATLPDREFELAVAGSPASHFRAPSNVKYLGFINNMADLYRAADLTVLPASYEPFGLVITESIACGTPVITAAVVGATDVMTPANGIVLDRLSVESLADAINHGRQAKFAMGGDFVRQHGLDLDAHIERLTIASGSERRCA